MDEKMNNCVSIECIYNDRMMKGLCIGVCGDTRSFSKDVIRMCWVKHKPMMGKKCDVQMQAQMTPREAVGVGVGLIRASIIGEHLLNSTRVAERDRKPAPAPVRTDTPERGEVSESESETDTQ